MLAALLTGLAGGVWSFDNTLVDPVSTYDTAWNIEITAMALLGGYRIALRSVLGAFISHCDCRRRHVRCWVATRMTIALIRYRFGILMPSLS